MITQYPDGPLMLPVYFLIGRMYLIRNYYEAIQDGLVTCKRKGNKGNKKPHANMNTGSQRQMYQRV